MSFQFEDAHSPFELSQPHIMFDDMSIDFKWIVLSYSKLLSGSSRLFTRNVEGSWDLKLHYGGSS